MNLFDPRTFSTDWEVMVIDHLQRPVSTEQLMGFAGLLQAETLLPIKVDWRTLEFPLGINTTYAQFAERIQRVTELAAARLSEYGLALFPAAAHPMDRMFNASHIHVGTLTDESAGLCLENRLLPYVPAFAALAANSPVWHGQRGAYKSYRVRHEANECIRPGSRRDPRFEQPLWGLDAGTRLSDIPTLEVRIIDCASSRRFLGELGVFVAAFVQMLGAREEDEGLTPERYREYLVNRWTAARDGLQATFQWNGAPLPVVEMISAMLDDCAPELRKLDAQRWDLALIELMLEKRLCQADMVIDLARRYPDPHALTDAYAKLARHWDAVDDYLASAPALDPLPPPDAEAIVAAHLAVIGEGTPLHRLHDVMSFPPTEIDRLLEQLTTGGLVTREVTPERGVRLSRATNRGGTA